MEQVEFYSFEDQVWYMKDGEQCRIVFKKEDLDKILLPKKIEIAGRRMRRVGVGDCGVGCGLEQG